MILLALLKYIVKYNHATTNDVNNENHLRIIKIDYYILKIISLLNYCSYYSSYYYVEEDREEAVQ